MELDIQIVSRSGVAVIRCRGRLIYGEEAAELGRIVRKVLDTNRHIVLQMADVSQIDSGGVGALGAAFMAAHNRDGEIKLAALSRRTAEVLRITALERLFEICSSENAAIDAFFPPLKAAVG